MTKKIKFFFMTKRNKVFRWEKTVFNRLRHLNELSIIIKIDTNYI